jgi:hypothetical protein
MMISLLIQFQVIWKIESSLLEYSPLAVASLMFIPHGIRAIAVVLSGASALAPIFLAHLITDLAIGLSLTAGAISGAATVLAMVVPLVLINYLSHKPALSPLAVGNTENLSLFRLVIVAGAISSLVNGAIGAARFSTSPLDLVALKYFIGDMLGVVVVLLLLLVAKNRLIAIGKRLA